MTTAIARDVQPRHSKSPATPKSIPYDLQEIKRQVGLTPFTQRIPLDSDGFAACPFHNGDSSRSFHVVQKENGAFIGTCFSTCGKSFDAIEFVKKYDDVQTGEAIRKLVSVISENGPAPATIFHKPKPAIPMSAEKWNTARNVTDADVAKLAASRPNSATPSTATLNAMGFRIGEKFGQTFLMAPYRLGDTFYTIKARNLETKEFIQENSVSQKGLFNIDAVTPECDVYIVESELDAAVLHEHGYIAVSVINAKQSQIEPEVLKHLTKAHRIFIVGDQDTAGQICMDNISRLLPPEKIYRMSFPDAKDMGELAVAFKKNDVILGDFKDQWNELRKDSLASWVTHNIPYISQLPSEPQKWIVDKLMPFGCYLLMTGKFGGTKSLTALMLAKGIETGSEVLGRKVTAKTKVLYVDRENPRDTIGIRRKRLGIPDDVIRYWGDWIDGMETPNLDDPRLAEFAIREQGVIIFDSLTDWLEGESENDASKMTEVSRKFRRLARLGAGVIVLHHDNKNGAGYRGSTAIPAGSDMALKMEKNETTDVIEIRTERFRMCGAWEMDIQYDFTADPWTCKVVYDRPKQENRKKKVADDLEIVAGTLATFHQENDGKPMSQTQLVKSLQASGISKAKTHDLLAAGVRDKQWEFKAGARNAILYSLIGWEPETATM